MILILLKAVIVVAMAALVIAIYFVIRANE